MMLLSRSDSLLTILTRCFSSSSSGTRRASSLTAPAIAVKGCRISCAMAAEIREVLKIENVAVALRVARTQRRNTDAQIADVPGGCTEVNLFPEGEPLAICVLTGEPEILIQFLQLLAAQINEAISEDFLAGAIQQQNASFQVRGDQTTAHRVDDVFGEVLKAKKFLALLFELNALFAKRLGQKAGQIGDSKKPQKIHDQPGSKALRRGESGEGARNLFRINKYGHSRKEQQTGGRD